MTVLATVIFADISGSVALYESLGNERAAEAVVQLTDWIGTCIHSHAGRVVKKLGDGCWGFSEMQRVPQPQVLRCSGRTSSGKLDGHIPFAWISA